MPEGSGEMERNKDRACYRHQLVQVDLTVVEAKVSTEIKFPSQPRVRAASLREQTGLRILQVHLRQAFRVQLS